MSYGDGGFYFLQPVGWGSSYGDAGSDYAEALPSKKQEKEGKWRTKHKGYDVVRRPVNIASEQERRAWLVFFKAKRNFWQKKVTNYQWIAGVAGPAGVAAAIAAVIATGGAAAAAALALGAGAGGATYSDLKAKYNGAKARLAWYKSCIKYVEKAKIVRAKRKGKYDSNMAQSDAKADAAAAVEADAALVAESKDIPEASATDAAAADAETPEAAAAEVAQVEAVEPAAKPETADVKVEDVKTVSTAAPDAKAEDETFLSKYGMYIGGAVVLGGAAYFFRDSLGFGDKKS